MAYSLCGFSAACPPGFHILPIVRLGADLAEAAIAFAAALPNVVVGPGMTVVGEPNNRVELRYGDHAERTETLTGGVRGWAWEDLRPHIEEVDVLYINFLAGNEMGLDVAERLRGVGVPVFADLHSLFLGPPGAGPRQRRRLPDWERWLSCFDAVQLNEIEMGLLGPERADALELLPRIPSFGPSAAFVTRGAAGAVSCVREGAGDVFDWPQRRRAGPGGSELKTPAAPGAEPAPVTSVSIGVAPLSGDPTGCGDIWGSVLFASLCGGQDVEAAMRAAHRAAAAKLEERRISHLRDAVAAALADPT